MPVQRDTTSAMSSSSTSSLSRRLLPVAARASRASSAASLRSSSASLPYLSSAALFRSYCALGLLDLAAWSPRSPRAARAARRCRPSRPPTARAAASARLVQLGELLLELLEPLARRRVGLLLERLALDLELHDPAVDLVELRRHRVDLGAQPRRGLVDQVDGLVGQEAVGDVAVREHRRGDEGRVLDADAVVHLVALAQAAQDRDRVLDRRLVDQHRLEAALERGVLLDVLAVLVERGGADAVQLAARQHGLEQVAGVHRALGRAGADDGVQLVDEEDDLALRAPAPPSARPSGAPRTRRGTWRPATSAPMSSATIRLSFRPSGTSPRTMRWARPSTMAVLPTPGSPISTGLFLVRRESTWMTRRISSSRPMTGSSLPLRGELGEVAAVLLERLVGGLGIGGRDALVAAHLLQGAAMSLSRFRPTSRTTAPFSSTTASSDVLDAHVLVLQRAHLVLGLGRGLRRDAG